MIDRNLSIIELLSLIRKVILEILIHHNNRFEKNEYFVVNRLLWGIEHIQKEKVPFIRLGIFSDFGSYYYELVIRYEEEYLILSKEGGERTSMGTDSFEKEYIYLDLRMDSSRHIDNQEIDSEKAFEWYNECKDLLADYDIKISIECYDYESNYLKEINNDR